MKDFDLCSGEDIRIISHDPFQHVRSVCEKRDRCIRYTTYKNHSEEINCSYIIFPLQCIDNNHRLFKEDKI